MRVFLFRLMNLFRRGRMENEMAQEFDFHLDMEIERHIQAGMSAEDARRTAKRRFGGVAQTQDTYRATSGFPWVEAMLQDVRYACRGLARNPGFTLVAVVTLALGIGVNATLFSAFNAAALKPLPVVDPDRVFRFERWFETGARGNIQYGFSYPEYVYCRDRGDRFSSLIAASWLFGIVWAPSASAPSQRLAVQLVSANYFADLGVNLHLGRGFLPSEDLTPGADTVAVLSYRFWRTGFHGDPQVLGQVIRLRGTAYTVVGITAEGFTGTSLNPQIPDMWAPLSMQEQLVPGPDWRSQPTVRTLQVFARLRPGTPLQSAQAQADLLVRQYDAAYPEPDRTRAATLERTTYLPNTGDIRFRALAAALMLVVGLVLLVACANVGNMLLARGAARQREISTRLALGAGRGRIARQLLAESILVSCMGGAAALAISVWMAKLLGALLQENAMFIGGDFSAVSLAPDLRVMSYVAAVSAAAGILCGLSPALEFTRRDLTSALKDGGASLSGLQGRRLRSFLVGTQVAVSMLLLAMAGLLTRGLIRSQVAEPGFATRDIFLVAGNFGVSGSDPAKGVANEKLLLERLRQRPELAAVARGSRPFLGTWTPPILVGNARGRTLASYASSSYFSLFRIPLVRGREFTPQEAASGAPLAIVSASTARRFWPGQDPIGKLLTLDMDFRGTLASFEVIGIVKDVRFANLTRIDPSHVYLATGSPMDALFSGIVFRIQGDRQRALAAAENTVESFDRSLVDDLRFVNLEDGVVRLQRSMSSAFTLLAGILAALALSLAGVGIYGVVAYLVTQRTREIGVRIALGATQRAVLKSVIGAGLRPVFLGMITGLAAAAALSSVLHATLVFPGSMDFFYGVPFYDPVTFLGLSGFVLCVAVLASAVPARRAAKVDPMIALRYE